LALVRSPSGAEPALANGYGRPARYQGCPPSAPRRGHHRASAPASPWHGRLAIAAVAAGATVAAAQTQAAAAVEQAQTDAETARSRAEAARTAAVAELELTRAQAESARAEAETELGQLNALATERAKRVEALEAQLKGTRGKLAEAEQTLNSRAARAATEGVAAAAELERLRSSAAEHERAAAGPDQRADRLAADLTSVRVAGDGVQRVQVVPSDDVGDFFAVAGEGGPQVRGHGQVAGLAVATGQRVVGDLAQHVLGEAVAAPLRRQRVRGHDEHLPAHQVGQRRPQLGASPDDLGASSAGVSGCR